MRSTHVTKTPPRHVAGAEEAGPAEAELAANLQAPDLSHLPLAGPGQGFGQLWEKQFWARLESAPAPEAVIGEWKRHFSEFWPGSSLLVADRLREDELVAADLEMPAGTRVTAGLMVVRSAADRFTLMTLRGHPFAAWVRFSARLVDSTTEITVLMRLRAGDPIYEAGMLLGGHRREGRFWTETLTAVAHHFGEAPTVHARAEVLDRRRQWSRVTNTWYNAAIRTQVSRVLSFISRPWRAMR